ncbi:glycosyltransferase [Methylobacterium sp. A54F]
MAAGSGAGPVRILLPTLYGTQGGSTRVLLASAAALRPGHHVTVRAPLPEADERVPLRFPAEPLTGARRKRAVLPLLARLVAAEAHALRRLRPDIIHVHDEPSLYVYGLAARLLRPRPHLLWHLHAPAGTGRSARLRAALADSCILISPHAAAPPGLPATLIRNPLALPDADGTPAPDRTALAVVGALGPRKGQDLAVEAFAQLRGEPAFEASHLTLIGPELDPAYAGALRARIAALGLGDAVTFAGERTPDQAFAGVGLALFSSTLETQPLALAEALARGLPVAASDIPAHRAMIAETGADKACLAPRDPARLAAAVRAARAQPADVQARTRALYAPERFAAGLRGHVAALAEVRKRL